METDPRIIVAVRPTSALERRPRLFAALEAAFPVAFRPWEPGLPGVAAVIAIVDDPCAPPAAGHDDHVPTFVVGGAPASADPAEDVQLLDADPVDPRVRGILLADRLVRAPLEPGERDEVLAVARSGPAWTRTRGPAPVDRVRAVLPELAGDQVLYALLSQRAIAAVALVHFLRAVCAPAGWRPPALRASFVFDDPNLRWRSYGYIDYARLVEHADAHGYHAAMAMIPIDAWRPHRATASLFAGRRDRLSLVFHGNDHIKHELLRPTDPGTALAVAAQSVRRIARFEHGSGVPVDRVMMPPHGLCSEAMAQALGDVGFDALCAIHPLPWTEVAPSDPPLAGWRPAEFIGGCAVVARIPLCSSRASIALRALLDHPLVIYGHHEDVAGGLEPLAEVAALVNGLGDVSWGPVGEIARGNHSLRLDGDRLTVRPHARRLRIESPASARTLRVEAPSYTAGEVRLCGWSLGDGPVVSFGEDLPIPGEAPVDVRLHGVGDVDPERVAAPPWQPWPRVRRAATEARDRALPLRPVAAR